MSTSSVSTGGPGVTFELRSENVHTVNARYTCDGGGNKILTLSATSPIATIPEGWQLIDFSAASQVIRGSFSAFRVNTADIKTKSYFLEVDVSDETMTPLFKIVPVTSKDT